MRINCNDKSLFISSLIRKTKAEKAMIRIGIWRKFMGKKALIKALARELTFDREY